MRIREALANCVPARVLSIGTGVNRLEGRRRHWPTTLLGIASLAAAVLFPQAAVASDPPGPCEDGYVAPTPVAVAVTDVPIEVASTTSDYFVLYVQIDNVVSVTNTAGATSRLPISVTLGEDGTTTLVDNLSPMSPDRYRVEKYSVAQPGDIDGDCVDDLTELADLGTYNPVNPANAIDIVNGAVAIDSLETFQQLSFNGTSQYEELGHLQNLEFIKFYILNTAADNPIIYFLNTNTTKNHGSFAHAIGMNISASSAFTKGEIVYHPNVRAPDGSLGIYRFSFQALEDGNLKNIAKYNEILASAIPLLENDLFYYPITETQLRVYRQKKESFDASRVNVLLEADILKDVDFLPFNQAEGYGRLRLMEDDDRPSPFDVAIYTTLPNDLPRVAGTITTVPQTPLSHVNLRAIQNGLPNAFIRDAPEVDAISSLLDGYVYFAVTADGYTIRAATKKEVDDHHESLRPQSVQTLQSDLTVTAIASLADVDFDDWTSYGVKAANVAELTQLSLPDGTTPVGFAVPFYFYDEFMKQATVAEETILGKKKAPDEEKIKLAPGTTLASAVTQMLAHAYFQSDADIQEEMLDDLRDAIKDATSPKFIIDALTAMHAEYPDGQSLRYRSSTNNEDLPSFNGAGLYSSKTQDPDETADDGIDKSIKGVWASLWNYRAFLERDFHRVDHTTVYMGVLVHPNYSDELVNGVAVSYDPITLQANAYYVNSQVGEDLVTNPEAYSQPEQLLLGATGSATVLSRSNLATSNDLLMSDAQMRQLRSNLKTIHDHFKTLYEVQDGDDYAIEIEFKITAANKLAIKQARPWIFAEPLELTPTVTIALSSAQAAEGAGLELTATRSGGVLSLPLAVDLAWSETGAMLASNLPAAVTIPGNQSSMTLTEIVDDDQEDEHDSTVTVSIADNSDYVIGTTGSTTATVTDDDLTQISVRADAGTVTEGSTADFTFKRSGSVLEQPLTVDITVNESGNRLTGPLPTTVAFAANSATASVSLATTDDSVRTPESTVSVEIDSGSGYGIGAAGVARLKIEDDELPGPKILTPLDHMFEHNKVGVVALHASKRDVSYAIAGPDVDDFTLYSSTGLVILEGRSFANPVDANRDGIYEIDLTVSARNAASTTVRMRFVITRDAFLSVTEQSWDQLDVSDRTALLPDIAISRLNRAFADLEDHVQATVAIVSRQGQIPAPGPTISISSGGDVTEGSDAAFTVTANPAPTADLDVTVSVSQIGDFGVDITARTVTIPSSGTQTLTMATTDDDIHESNGSVTATVDRGSGYLVSHASGQATVAINDDDDPPAVTPEVSIAAGGGIIEGGDAVFTITADPAPVSALTVDVTVAQAGDFGVSVGSHQVTVPTSGGATLTVATTNDSTDEADGSVTATLSDGQDYTVSVSVNTATVAVSDDDVPEVSIAAGSGVTEGGDATFTITADPAPPAALSVDVTVAQSGDFGVVTGSRQVAVSTSGTATLTVSSANDSTDESDGSVRVTVDGGSGYTVSSTAGSATVAVSDDDDPVVVTPEASIAAGGGIIEGGDATFTITADPAPPAALSVDVTVAQSGDFGVATGSRQVTVPTSGTATLTLSTTGDDVDEPDGSVTVTVDGGSGYSVSSVAGSASVAVADDDDAPVVVDDDPPVVVDACVAALSSDGSVDGEWTAACASVGRVGRYARFFTFSLAGQSAVTVDLESSVDTYLYLRSGKNQKSGTALHRDDDGGSGYNSRIVESLSAGDYTIEATTYSGSRTGLFKLTVAGLPAAPAVEPEISIAAGLGVIEGGDAVFTVTASPAPSSALAVDVTVAPSGDFGVSAGSQTVTIPTSGSATLTVATVNDSIDESDGSVTVTVDDGSDYTVSATAGAATVAVADDDAAPPVDPAPVACDAAEAIEKAGAAFDWHSSHGSEAPLFWRILNTLGAQNLPAKPSQVAVETVTAQEVGDFSEGKGWPGWAPVVAALRCVESTDTTEPAATPEVSITAGSGVTEGADAVFTVTADPVPASPLSVEVTVAQSGDFGVGTGSRQVTVSAGGTATLTVATVNDSADEADGSVTVTVNSGSGYSVSSTAGAAAVAVADDDDPAPPPPPPVVEPEVSIAAGAGVAEGGDAVFTVTADPAPSSALSVDVAVTQSGDYGVGTGSRQVTVPAGGTATLTVSTVNDSADEADGSVTVTVNSGSGYTVSATQRSATVAVTDNDDPPPPPPPADAPGFSIADASGTEGEQVTVTVTLSDASSQRLRVYWKTEFGGSSPWDHRNPIWASPGSDYDSAGGWLTFQPGVVQQRVQVNLRDDSRVEPAEEFQVNLVFVSPYGAVPFADRRAIITITDND